MFVEHQLATARQIGDGACHPPNSVVTTTGELVAFELVAQGLASCLVKRCQRIQVRSRNVGIDHADSLKSQPASVCHPCRDHRRRLAATAGE